MTFVVVRKSPLTLIAGPWATIPGTIQVNGIRIDSAPVGYDNGNYRLVEVVYANQPPTEHHTVATTDYSLSATQLTITRTFSPPTLSAVKAILKARLNQDATTRWIACRGVLNIEAAYNSGVSTIDAAGGIAAAINAYNSVEWS